MNRITILLLLIGSAVLVIGLNRFQPEQHESATPWSVEHNIEGEIVIFGITLGSSTPADALSRFDKKPDSYVLVSPTHSLKLISIFKGVIFDRLIADIELEYSVSQQILKNLIDKKMPVSPLQTIHISEQQLSLLENIVIRQLSYSPTIDYDEDMVLQRFGYPDSKEQLDTHSQRWLYKSMNLQIYLNDTATDKLVYSAETLESHF